MRRTLAAIGILWLALDVTIATADILPEEPTVTRLDNGLTVVTLPWDSPGMAAYYTLVRTGSRDETDKAHTGFAHLFEHMMFRGTERFPKEKYEAKIQEFGADNNAFTWFDLTCFTVTLPTEVLTEVIEIEADRFRNLAFSEQDFQTEAGAVLGEYNMNASGPGLIMEEKLLGTAFERHTYGHTTMGYLADVKAMPGYYEYSKRFHKSFYTPDNTILIIVGDFDRAAVMKKIEAEYGPWKGERRKTRAKVEREQRAPRTVHVEWPGATAPMMTIAYKTPAFSPGADSAALEILAHLVFGESGPLYRRLVIEERKVLSMQAWSGIFAPLARDPFLFRVELTLAEGTTYDEVQEAVDAAIAEAASGAIPDERVNAVKSHAKNYFALGLETPSDAAQTIAMFLSATGAIESIEAHEKALAEVTPEQVARAAATYLTAKRRTTVTLASVKGGAK